MIRTFCFTILSVYILNGSFAQKTLERSEIQEHVKMEVLFSSDSVEFGGMLHVTIILKNISQHPIVLLSDANFIMERWVEGTFASQSVFLSDFNANFKLKETIQPQESFTKEYNVVVVPPFFYRGKVYIRFLYIAKPSKKLIDIIYQDKWLKII